MIDFFLWAAGGLMIAAALYLFKWSDHDDSDPFPKPGRLTGGRRRGVPVEASLPRAKARTRKKEVVMLKKVTNAALKRATATTRSGGQIGAAAGANFVKCFIKELSKLKASEVLKIIEASK